MERYWTDLKNQHAIRAHCMLSVPDSIFTCHGYAANSTPENTKAITSAKFQNRLIYGPKSALNRIGDD